MADIVVIAVAVLRTDIRHPLARLEEFLLLAGIVLERDRMDGEGHVRLRSGFDLVIPSRPPRNREIPPASGPGAVL